MLDMYNKSEQELDDLGKKGRNHVMTNYSMENYINLWTKLLADVFERNGSWESRDIKNWSLSKII